MKMTLINHRLGEAGKEFDVEQVTERSYHLADGTLLKFEDGWYHKGTRSKAAKRTDDDLDTLIESFGYGYVPIDEYGKTGKQRYRAYAHRLKENGEMEFEVTADFGWEDELLSIEQDKLVQLIKKEIDETNKWDAEHS